MVDDFCSPPHGHPNAEKRPLNPKKHTSTPYSDECHLFLGNNFQIMFVPPPSTCAAKTTRSLRKSGQEEIVVCILKAWGFFLTKMMPKKTKVRDFFFCIGTLSPTIIVQWKITLNERTLILEGRIFHWTMIMEGRVNPFKLCVYCFISDLFVWMFLSSYYGKINRLYKIHH